MFCWFVCSSPCPVEGCGLAAGTCLSLSVEPSAAGCSGKLREHRRPRRCSCSTEGTGTMGEMLEALL